MGITYLEQINQKGDNIPQLIKLIKRYRRINTMKLRRDIKPYIQIIENIVNRYEELEFELYHTYTNSYMLKDFFHDIIIYINEGNKKITLIKEEREYNLTYTLDSINSLVFYLDVIVKNHI